MSNAETGQITAEAAGLYERFFVPALFAQWPPELLRAAAVGPGQLVLDVGCGTGVLARAAGAVVGPAGPGCSGRVDASVSPPGRRSTPAPGAPPW